MLYPNKFKSKSNTINQDVNNKNSSKKIDQKRKEIIEKFSVRFDKIHHKSYELGKLVRVLNFFLDKPEVVENFNFDKDFDSYEKKVCERLNIQSNSTNILHDLKANNTDFLAKSNRSNNKEINNSIERNSEQILITTEDHKEAGEFLPIKSKMEILKHKEMDEWAKIAVIKSQELSDELTKKRREEQERRRKIREDLAQQILLKNNMKSSVKEYDGFFDKIQSENNDRYDKQLVEKKEKQKNESKKVQEFSESIKDKYQEELNRKREEEMQMLNIIKFEEEKERKKLISKRLNEKILFNENIIETELMKKRKTEIKEKETENDKVFLDYNYFVNDKNCKSKHSYDERYYTLQDNNALSQANNNKKSKIQDFQSTEELQKYEKEFHERNNGMEKAEVDKRLRNQKKIKEINDTLAKQVIERKHKQMENEKINKDYYEVMKKDLEIYRLETELENKAVKDKYIRYKTELKRQIDDRFNFKEKSITDDEIKLNKNLLNRINYIS